MAIGNRLRLRLFIEGVEVPLIAANIQAAPNSPVACSLQVPPLEEAMLLKPMSLVHLFFFDYAESASHLVSLRAEMRKYRNIKDPTVYEQTLNRRLEMEEGADERPTDADLARDQRNEKYKLCFVGEIVRKQYTKSLMSRSAVLQCMGLSSYWDRAFQTSAGDLFGPGYQALFAGGATNLFTDFFEEKGGAILRIINTPSDNYPSIKGLPGGLIHLVEAIGGNYYAAPPEKGTAKGQRTVYAGQNIYFSLAELRLHFTQMIHAAEKDDTAYRLMGPSWDALFGRTLGGLGERVSIRQAINALSGLIFYETYDIPTPRYIPGLDGTISGYTRKRAKDDEKAGPLIAALQDISTSLKSRVSQLQNLRSLSAEESVPAAILSSTSVGIKTALLKQMDTIRDQLTRLSREAKAKQLDPLIAPMTDARTTLAKVQATVRDKRWVPATSDAVTEKTTALLGAAAASLDRAGDLEVSYTPPAQARPAKLVSSIYRPDVWFAAPPRCNVIFPDQYTQISYDRDDMAAPTRLMLQMHDEFFGPDELFDHFVFAPRAPAVGTATNTPKSELDKERITLQRILSNDIMPHELYTGIIPVFEKMGEFNVLAVRDGKVKGKTPKVGLAQRTANFLFFRYRFGSRQIQVEGLFDPYLVPGFPCLVIDRPTQLEVANNYWSYVQNYGRPPITINQTLGTHFLANIHQLAHSLSQTGGQTSLVCGFAREWLERVEFLNSIDRDEDLTVKKRYGSDALRSTDVAALSPPEVGQLGPNAGVIVSVSEVTDQYVPYQQFEALVTALSLQNQFIYLPLYSGSKALGTGQKPRVPIGVPVRPLQLGDAVRNAFPGAEDVPQTFRAYRVQEEVPRYRRETVDLPAEEMIRPGWYGDVWRNDQIGEVYESYFRTGAITDPQQLVDPQGASQGIPDKDAPDMMADAAQGRTPGDGYSQAPALYALDKDASIEQAVSFLLLAYSYVRASDPSGGSGQATRAFIDAYKWRPIATLPDMFGSSDLRLSTTLGGQKVEQGVEGFHSRAFGPHNNFFGLVTSDIRNILGIEPQSLAATKGDVRKDKQDAVLVYVAKLMGGAKATIG